MYYKWIQIHTITRQNIKLTLITYVQKILSCICFNSSKLLKHVKQEEIQKLLKTKTSKEKTKNIINYDNYNDKINNYTNGDIIIDNNTIINI
jgi:hypothetical protein